MAEQRAVLEAVAARTDMYAPYPEPGRSRNRNVTMDPGARRAGGWGGKPPGRLTIPNKRYIVDTS